MIKTNKAIWIVCATAITLSCTFQTILAQEITLPYFNSWEDDTENSLWTMNSGINGNKAKNRWYISTKQSFTGNRSLLISDLSISPDTNDVYSNSQVNIIAARDIILPSGTYELSFAWRAFGEKDADGLYVAWIPANSDISTTVTTEPSWLKNAKPFNGKMFCNNMIWQVENTTIIGNNKPMKLVFLWKNNDKKAAKQSVCIDDIQISNTACNRPENIHSTVKGRDITLTWDTKPNSTYKVRYICRTTGKAEDVKNVVPGRATVTDMPNGLYDFYIQVRCNTETSIWYIHRNTIINVGPCIDFTNFEAPGVTCYLGNSPQDPYGKTGIDIDGIEEGGVKRPPRHSVITEQGITDPLTGGELLMIPPDEFISVRLGNEDINRSEAIEYTLPLDSGSKVTLLMKYAIVLEAPDEITHTPENMPKFHIEVRDANGRMIDPQCGQIDFYSTVNLLDEGWHLSEVQRLDAVPIIYKDWTTIGLNLTKYALDGDTHVKIRIATHDCGMSAHFGYAYFTLQCTSATIEGLTCGDNRTEEISAPFGFNYHWYKKYFPDEPVPGNDQRTLHIAENDTSTYCCNVISKENDACFVTLEAALMPRYPKAAVRPIWCPQNCQNAIRFENISYIETQTGISDEQITDFEWDFGNGVTSKQKSPTIGVSENGDTIHVSLKASITNGICFDIWDSTLIIPSIGSVRDTVEKFICEGEKFKIDDTYYDQEGYYPKRPVTSYVTGCDSISVVHLKYMTSSTINLDTTICAGDTLCVNGNKYSFTGNFTDRLSAAGGCDSIYYNIKLTVLPEVTFGVQVNDVDNGPNSGSIIITDTLPGTYYTLNDSLNAPLTGLPEGEYTIVCYNRFGCESLPKTVTVGVHCTEYTPGDAGDICAGDTEAYIPVTVTHGNICFYSLNFSDSAKEQGFSNADSIPFTDNHFKLDIPANARPGHYTAGIKIIDMICNHDTVLIPFSILYPTSVIRQKWNDVLALINSGYLHGYTFVSYRWYKNGKLIPDSEAPYLYIGENETFDPTDEYRAELTDPDGITLFTCPYFAELRSDTHPYPIITSTAPKQEVKIENITGKATVSIYDIGGICHGQYSVSNESPYFTAPATCGIYVVKITGSGYVMTYKITVF